MPQMPQIIGSTHRFQRCHMCSVAPYDKALYILSLKLITTHTLSCNSTIQWNFVEFSSILLFHPSSAVFSKYHFYVILSCAFSFYVILSFSFSSFFCPLHDAQAEANQVPAEIQRGRFGLKLVLSTPPALDPELFTAVRPGAGVKFPLSST